MKSFSAGDRVFVRAALGFGRDKAGTVEACMGDAVLVKLDGKAKPAPFKRSRVRMQEERRTNLHAIVGGRAAVRPAVPPPAPKIEAVLDAFAADVATAEQIETTYQEAIADGTVTESEVKAAAERFMERPPIRAMLRPPPPAKLHAVPKSPAPDRDATYLRFVRGHACIGCARTIDVDAHHWARRGQKGMGTKPSDYQTVPLCTDCHTRFHAAGDLPAMNGTASKVWILAKQVDLLVAWVRLLTAKLAERRSVR